MTEKIINEMINYFNKDIKRINHALKVYAYSKAISQGIVLSEKDRLVIEITALLHDIGIHEAEKKYGTSSGKYQQIEGPPIAERIMEKSGISPEITKRVCYITGHHHDYKAIEGIDFQIIIEADFLVNAFEDNMTEDQIKTMKEKYFKTEKGKRILDRMFLNN